MNDWATHSYPPDEPETVQTDEQDQEPSSPTTRGLILKIMSALVGLPLLIGYLYCILRFSDQETRSVNYAARGVGLSDINIDARIADQAERDKACSKFSGPKTIGAFKVTGLDYAGHKAHGIVCEREGNPPTFIYIAQ